MQQAMVPADLTAQIEALRQDFLEALPEKVDELQRLVARCRDTPDPEIPRRARLIAHRLAGSGGAFGCHELGVCAKNLEIALAAWCDGAGTPDSSGWATLDALMAALVACVPVAAPETPAVPMAAAPYRVLVVDDTEAMARLHALILDAAGMTTATLIDPEQIMSRLTEFAPDLILMDMYLPTCTGVDLALRIRGEAAFAALPIIYLSAETDADKQRSALAQVGDAFLTKPVAPARLVAAVSARLAGRR